MFLTRCVCMKTDFLEIKTCFWKKTTAFNDLLLKQLKQQSYFKGLHPKESLLAKRTLGLAGHGHWKEQHNGSEELLPSFLLVISDYKHHWGPQGGTRLKAWTGVKTSDGTLGQQDSQQQEKGRACATKQESPPVVRQGRSRVWGPGLTALVFLPFTFSHRPQPHVLATHLPYLPHPRRSATQACVSGLLLFPLIKNCLQRVGSSFLSFRWPLHLRRPCTSCKNPLTYCPVFLHSTTQLKLCVLFSSSLCWLKSPLSRREAPRRAQHRLPGKLWSPGHLQQVPASYMRSVNANYQMNEWMEGHSPKPSCALWNLASV